MTGPPARKQPHNRFGGILRTWLRSTGFARLKRHANTLLGRQALNVTGALVVSDQGLGLLQQILPASVFGLRFNRVRERGRGWLLAGFQIEGVRAREAMAG